MPSKYESLFADADQQINANLLLSESSTPEKEAQNRRIASMLGVPADVVGLSPDEFRQQALSKSVSEAAGSNPVLGRRYTREDFARIAQDDGKPLGTLGAAFNSYRRGQIGLGQIKEAVQAGASLSYYEKLTKADAAADSGESEAAIRTGLGFEAYTFSKLPKEDRMKRLQALKMQTMSGVAESAQRLAIMERKLAEFPSSPDMERFQQAEGFGEQAWIAATNPIDILSDILPQSLVEIVPAVVAAPVIGPTAIGISSGASAYREALLSSLREQGVDVADGGALIAALNDPAIFRKANEYAVGYSGAVGLTDAVSAGAFRLTPFGRKFSDVRTQREGVIATGRQRAGNFAVETGVQGSFGAAGEILGTGEVTGDALLEFLAEAVTGPVTESVAVLGERRAIALAERQAKAQMDEIAKLVAATKLRERDPKELADLVNDMAEDAGAPTTLYVDAADLGQALQQSGMSIQEFADLVPSAKDSVLEGFVAQTTIEIPVGDALVHIKGSKIDAALTQKLRTKEDGFSPEQAASFLQSYEDNLSVEAEKILTGKESTDQFRADAKAVREKVESELIAAGRKPEVAAKEARLSEAYFTRLASDWRVSDPAATPMTMFRRVYGDRRMVAGGAAAGGFNQAAYHGSPYRFSKFSLEHMGKGEGVQAYGWGLYFASERDVAMFYTPRNEAAEQAAQKEYEKAEKSGDYESLELWEEVLLHAPAKDIRDAERFDHIPRDKREKVAKAVEKIFKRHPGSQLYRVEIPSDDQYMLWDKPLSEQPAHVQKAIEAIYKKNRDESFLSAVKAYDSGDTKAMKAAGFNIFDYPGATGALYTRAAEIIAEDRRMDEQRSHEAVSRFLNSQGVPGIKYLDGTSRGPGEGSYNYVIFDDATIEIVDRFYQSADGSSARGAFLPSTAQLHLLANADGSTFIHESGHQFLDLTVRLAMEPDAPALLKKRASDALEWLGIESTPELSRAEVWSMMTLEEQRPYHEKFAETFEQYLFTGKAPSIAMAEVFRAFKRFMKTVYQSMKLFAAKNKGAELDPEISAIFDRMLATEEEITEAEAARAMFPIFSEPPAGVTPEEWRAYQEDQSRANDLATEYVDAKRLADMRYIRVKAGKTLTQMRKDVAGKRFDMRWRAKASVMSRPVYQAISFLSRSANPEDVLPTPIKADPNGPLDPRRDSLFMAIAKLGGLDWKEAASDGWWDDTGRSPMAGFGLPVLRRKGGLSVESMAESLAEYGYVEVDENGKHVLEDLADKFTREAGGKKVYSSQRDYAESARADAEEQTPGITANISEFWSGRLDRYSVDAIIDRVVSAMAGSDDQVVGERDALREAMAAKIKPLSVSTGGIDVQLVAEMFGYATGEDLLRDIMYAPDESVAIEAETDRMMLEEYGDITSPESLARAVDEAISNNVRSRVLATELRMLDKAVGSVVSVLKAARSAAAEIIAAKTIGSIRPDKYRLAAARLGRQAVERLAAGDMKGAAIAKRGQVLNNQLAIEADKVRGRVESFGKDIRRWFKDDKSVSKSHDMDMVAVARDIVGRYGLVSDKRAASAESAIARIAEYDPTTAADLAAIVAGLPDKKPYEELTADEFHQVRTVAEAAWNLSTSNKRYESKGASLEYADAAARTIAALGTANEVPLDMKRTPTRADKFWRFLMSYASNVRRVESFLDLAGLRDFLLDPVANAVARHHNYKGKFIRKYLDLLQAHKDHLDDSPISAPELGGFVFSNGKPALLHAILHTGNDSNMLKLLVGREWSVMNPDGTVNESLWRSQWDAFMARMYTEGKITKADMDFCQSVWDLMEEMKPFAQKAHRKIYGYFFNEVTARPMETPFGTYRGGYVPAIASALDMDKQAKVDAEALVSSSNSFAFPSTGNGFAKNRVAGYNRPLELNLGSIVSHIDAVSRFVNVEESVRSAARLIGRRDVKQAFDAYLHGSVQSILMPWLQRAARQTSQVPSGFKAGDEVINYLNTRSGVSTMAGNISNALQQLTGPIIALISDRVSKASMARAMWNVNRNPRVAALFASEKDPWMKSRIENASFEMQSQIEAVLLGSSALDDVMKADQWIRQHAYFLQTLFQNRVDVIVWHAAYEFAKENGKSDADAVSEAAAAVRLTQGSFEPQDIANIESGVPIWRAVMKFYPYFSMLLNLMYTESVKRKRNAGSWVMATPALAMIWLVYFGVANAIAQAIATGLPEDEDNDGIEDEILPFYLTANGKTLAALVPGFGGPAVAMAATMDDKPYNDRLSVPPMFSLVERAVKGAAAAGGIAQDDVTAKEVRGLLAVLGLVVPTGQVSKTAGYLTGLSTGEVAQPESVFDLVAGAARGR